MMGDGPPAVTEAPTWQPPEQYANDNEMDLPYVEPEPQDQPLEDTLVIEPEEPEPEDDELAPEAPPNKLPTFEPSPPDDVRMARSYKKMADAWASKGRWGWGGWEA